MSEFLIQKSIDELAKAGFPEVSLMESAQKAVHRAGQALLEILKTKGLDVIRNQSEKKADGSPVTMVDLETHQRLVTELKVFSDFPIVSEEDPGGPLSIEKIPDGSFFWLMDPIDGTRDFLAGEESYAVLLSLMRKFAIGEKHHLSETQIRTGAQAYPHLGIVYSPARETMWSASRACAFAKWQKSNAQCGPAARVVRPLESGLRVTGSRSIPSEKTEQICKFWKTDSLTRLGSAIKFALIAEGVFDVYPRFGPTSEWDTAAGQVLLEAVGGGVAALPAGQARDIDELPILSYGKKGWRNPGFLAAGSIEILETWLPRFSAQTYP